MELQEFLALLRVESGPNASGEYMCRCPAHDDSTASLCVTEGPMERGKNAGAWAIKFCCQAGCDNAEIMRRLNIKPKDLYPASHADPKRQPPLDQRVRKGKELPPPQRKKRDLGKLTTVYHYTDEAGKPLFEVCRYEREEDGKSQKTFLQRVHDPRNIEAKFDGYVYKADHVRHPLYRLPEVLEAIHAGKPVYLVEGEKDADNLASLGFTATTNPGGASKKGLAIKWQPEHTESLRGGDVIILPDIDETGTYDRRKVARLLLPGCKSVKLLDLTQSGMPLPEKGDITDLFKIAKKARGLKILAKLEADTPTLTAQMLDELDKANTPEGETPAENDPEREKAAERMNSIPGYCVEDGCICKWESEENHRRLCAFLAVPVAEITRDDGLNVETVTLIDGWTRDGARLPQVRVNSKVFDRMGWVMDNWGLRGNILPGSTVKDNLRYAIAAAGEKGVKRYTEYNHTGWRKIGGKWAYLYQGGAIGNDSVAVELGSGLQAYRLDGNGDPGFVGISQADAIMASISLVMNLGARHLMVPLLATAYLAPLKEAMDTASCSPNFSLFLVGESGCGKSTASALALSHFGSFTANSLPASFNDTANYIQKKAFLLKDVPIVVDDYHPTSSIQERRRMEATAQSLSRTFGDNATRKRMNSDTSLREDTPPRCISIISGESTPNVGESGVARFFLINVEKGDVPMDDALTAAQECARKGYLAKAMCGYIEWLLPQMDTLSDRLLERFQALRSKAQKEASKRAHNRAPGTIACLMLGYEMMLTYMTEAGELAPELADRERKAAWDTLLANSAQQAEESAEERPGRAFLRTLGEMLVAKIAAVRDLTDGTQASDPARGMVGWMDNQYYYIMPEMAFTLVSEQVRKQGIELQLPQRSLYRQMRSDGFITPPPTSKTYSYLKRVRSDKPAERVLWIPRKLLDGGEPAEEQIRIENLSNGHTVVDGEEIPF